MQFVFKCSAICQAIALLAACSGSQVGVLEAPINPEVPFTSLALVDDETLATLGLNKGILEMRLASEGASAEVHRYQGDVWKDDLPVGEFSTRAKNGEATVRFTHLEPGAYTLRFSALDVRGRPIPTSEGNDQASSGPHVVNAHATNCYNAYHRPNRLKVRIEAKDGEFGTHVRTPGVAAISLPAQALTIPRGGRVAQLPPIDDNGHMTMTSGDFQRTTDSRYIAIGMSNDGTSSIFLGSVRFAHRANDPLNPGNPTLFVDVLGATKKFFFNEAGQLTAVADVGRRRPERLVNLVDPEMLPDELYVSAVFPFGTPARNYFYLTENRSVHELVLGPNPGDGLLGATFPDARVGAVHIQRVRSRDEHPPSHHP